MSKKVIQFGTGRFLRAFADYIIHETNQTTSPYGSVTIIQTTGEDSVQQLRKQNYRFHVLTRGIANQKIIDTQEEIASITQAYTVKSNWKEIQELFASPEAELILSNTTEVGYRLDESDSWENRPAKSFPAKLLQLLFHRYGQGGHRITIVPCELMEHNAQLLLDQLLILCQKWNLDKDFQTWLQFNCIWLETLVDRIVTKPVADSPILQKDPLTVTCEPFAFWAVQSKANAAELPHHPAIVRAADISSYFLRKVRILNAAHTALLVKAYQKGYKIVRDAIHDQELNTWLKNLLFDEILPTLEGRIEAGELFANQTIERFQNPFLDHRFADIAQNHASKVNIRLSSTLEEYRNRFGKNPSLLSEVIKEGLSPEITEGFVKVFS